MQGVARVLILTLGEVLEVMLVINIKTTIMNIIIAKIMTQRNIKIIMMISQDNHHNMKSHLKCMPDLGLITHKNQAIHYQTRTKNLTDLDKYNK